MRQLFLVVPSVLLLSALGGCSKPKPTAPPPRPAAQPAAETESAAAPAAEPASEPAQTPTTEPAPEPATASPAAEEKATAVTDIDALIETLTTTDDGRTRVVTIDAIADLGQRAKPAIAALVKATTDADPRPRWHAARALGMIGEDAIDTIPTLVALLDDADPIVAAQSAAAIGMIRRDDSRTDAPEKDATIYAQSVEPLVKAVTHPDPRVRRAAVRALREMAPEPGAFLPLLSERLADADPSVVMPVLHTLANMEGEAVPALVAALGNAEARYWAAVALAEIGAEAAPAVEPLGAMIAEGEIHEQLQAILALAAIGEAARPAAPRLLEILESGDASLHLPTVYALGAIGATDAGPKLEAIAADDAGFLGAIAAWGRARLDPDDAALRNAAIERLQGQLASEDVEERSGAVSALATLAAVADADTRAALAARFVSLLNDPHPSVGLGSGSALVGLGPDAVEVLRGTLANPGMRAAGLQLLAAIGPASAPALDDLTAVLQDASADPEHRAEAAVALGAIGEKAAPAAALLAKQLDNVAQEPFPAYAAAYALGRIGPAAKEAARDTLHKYLESDDDLLATVAVWASLKVDPDDRSHFDRAIPLLRKALQRPDELARVEAAVALGDIGTAAASAVPILELVSEEDGSKDVRRAAAEALAKIRPRR